MSAAKALERRVLQPARESGLEVTVHEIQNAADVNPACYLRFALVLERSSAGSGAGSLGHLMGRG
jgi:hypothetical protein